MSEEPLKSYDEAAAWLGVSVRWLHRGVQAGRLPHTRLGKHVRFTKEHLDAIVAAGERSGPKPAATNKVAGSGTAVMDRRAVLGRRRS